MHLKLTRFWYIVCVCVCVGEGREDGAHHVKAERAGLKALLDPSLIRIFFRNPEKDVSPDRLVEEDGRLRLKCALLRHLQLTSELLRVAHQRLEQRGLPARYWSTDQHQLALFNLQVNACDGW